MTYIWRESSLLIKKGQNHLFKRFLIKKTSTDANRKIKRVQVKKGRPNKAPHAIFTI